MHEARIFLLEAVAGAKWKFLAQAISDLSYRFAENRTISYAGSERRLPATSPPFRPPSAAGMAVAIEQLPVQSCHEQVFGICLSRHPCCRSLGTWFLVGSSFTTMQVNFKTI